MRIAAYNVENLFNRPKAMNLETWEDGRESLEQFSELKQLLGEQNYTAQRKERMVELLVELGLERSDIGPFVILRRNRGRLLTRPRSGGVEITASGRGDWVGSVELRDEAINEISVRNTAKVIAELKADILAVVEAESRPALLDFNRDIFRAIRADSLHHVMLIDGNDSRGIDVGIMTGREYPIGLMMSHVDDRLDNGRLVFSRDCPEFFVKNIGSGESIVVMVNHFKSKGYGSIRASNARRKAQASRVAEIYSELVRQGNSYVVVLGDLNDTPDSDPLSPLLRDTDLRDISDHDAFDDGGYAGTYGNCSPANKIDYILLSPSLFSAVVAGGVCRKGMWPGVRARRWDAFPEVDSARHAASDHAALWVDLEF